MDKGHLIILSAPSGAGKTTLCEAIRKRFPTLRYSISHTTRTPRPGEKDGVDYHFIDVPRFKEMIRDHKWLEWAEVHGNFYGTSADFIHRQLSEGFSVLLDIDVQGARQIANRHPACVKIFIMPPSLPELSRRLASRGTDSPETIQKRLANAQNEIAQSDFYDYIIMNDQLSAAIEKLGDILKQYLPENIAAK